MATGVNMCNFRTLSNYVRCVLNQHTRPLLTNSRRCPFVTHKFHAAYCRLVFAESSTTSALRYNHFVSRRTQVGVPVLLGNPCLQHLDLRFLSREQKPSITEEILKSKLDETVKNDAPTSSRNESKTSSDKSNSLFAAKNAWKLGLLSLVGMSILTCGNLLILWGSPQKDEDGDEIPDEFTDLPAWKAYAKRALKEARSFTKMIQEPSSMKLLPDPLKEPYYQPKYTLVLEMTGVLVHPDWTLSTGWRFKKRPGLDYFLQQVGFPVFEVVIYTHEQGFTAFPIIDGIDQNGLILFRLFRDATRYVNGSHVKDLACLNRDLSKVIIVDCDSKAFAMQPENAFLLKKWNGDDSDRTLIDLAAFLKTIVLNEVEDVRPVLEFYSQFDDPIVAFREKQRQLQEQSEEQARASSEQKSKTGVVGGWSFGLTGLKRAS